jgi:hypothetical protein
MTRAYSIDLREGVVRQVEAGGSVRRVAAMFAVSPSFVVKLAQAWRQRGTVAARPQGGDRRSTALERHRDWQLVAETPDLTLRRSATGLVNTAPRHRFRRSGACSTGTASVLKKPPTPPNARSARYGPESASCSTNLPPTNAGIISLTPDTFDRKMLSNRAPDG